MVRQHVISVLSQQYVVQEVYLCDGCTVFVSYLLKYSGRPADVPRQDADPDFDPADLEGEWQLCDMHPSKDLQKLYKKNAATAFEWLADISVTDEEFYTKDRLLNPTWQGLDGRQSVKATAAEKQ
jgi:hypothetical protein